MALTLWNPPNRIETNF